MSALFDFSRKSNDPFSHQVANFTRFTFDKAFEGSLQVGNSSRVSDVSARQ